MKSSAYNVTAANSDGGLLLYNTLYGSLTVVEPSEVADVARALAEPDSSPGAVVGPLRDQHHLVADDVDELAVVKTRRARGIADTNRLDVVVMPTLDCNFDCVYCYEEHVRGTCMSPEVERRTCRWLTREIPGSKLVMLHWFGGEPLIDVPLITRVTRHAFDVASATGSSVAPHVTTNGFLLRGWRRDALLAADVTDFQVTLDGPARTHDRLRPRTGGGPTFGRVFANIVETVRADERVGMTLRINLNHTNIDQAPELLEAFDSDVRPRLRLVLEPIFGDQSVSATLNIAREELSGRLTELYAEGARLGYEVSAASAGLLTGRLTYCYAERERQVVLAPDGSVFKCAAGSFALKDRLGVLTEDGSVESPTGALETWMSYGGDFPPRCTSCAYLPLCMGGCRKVQAASPTGVCTLVPSNAAYVLKQIALSGFPHSLVGQHPGETRKEVMTT